MDNSTNNPRGGNRSPIVIRDEFANVIDEATLEEKWKKVPSMRLSWHWQVYISSPTRFECVMEVYGQSRKEVAWHTRTLALQPGEHIEIFDAALSRQDAYDKMRDDALEEYEFTFS